MNIDIKGLENNYYLAGNDIWVSTSSMAENTLYIKVKRRSGVGNGLPDELIFTLNKAPHNSEFLFNISLPIRALFLPPTMKEPNTLHRFIIYFSTDKNFPRYETLLVDKYFIRGAKQHPKGGNRHTKQNGKNWHLENGSPLYVGEKWIFFPDLLQEDDYQPKAISGNEIVPYYTPEDEVYNFPIRNKCNYFIVKFLNSLGAYQYFPFETFEIKTKTKPRKTINRIATHLAQDNFINQGSEVEQTIQLSTKTPAVIQEVFEDLVKSQDVYLIDPKQTGGTRYQRLILEDNESTANNYDQTYNNKITFSIAQKTTKWI